MRTSVREGIRSLVHRALIAVHDAGFDVTRETFRSGLIAGLDRLHVDTVLDVGANTGQFAPNSAAPVERSGGEQDWHPDDACGRELRVVLGAADGRATRRRGSRIARHQ